MIEALRSLILDNIQYLYVFDIWESTMLILISFLNARPDNICPLYVKDNKFDHFLQFHSLLLFRRGMSWIMPSDYDFTRASSSVNYIRIDQYSSSRVQSDGSVCWGWAAHIMQKQKIYLPNNKNIVVYDRYYIPNRYIKYVHQLLLVVVDILRTEQTVFWNPYP